MLQSYSTKESQARNKVAYWNEIVSDIFTPLETSPITPQDFEAEVRCAPMGRLWLAEANSLPATVERSRKQAHQASSQRYFLHMQMQGSLTACQDGKEAELEVGDLVLCDSTLPYTLKYDEPCRTLVLIIPKLEMRKHLPTPEQMVGVKLSGERGLSRMTSAMLGSLWAQAQEELAPEAATRIGDSLLDVFATSCTQVCGARLTDTAVSGARRLQIKRFIETNLREPDLSARYVASAFNISPRYLHMLFSAEGESVSNFILRRRLEECVKNLTGSLWRKRTIIEIAFGWGFNNATHFSRVFKERYGQSPREYRNAHARTLSAD